MAEFKKLSAVEKVESVKDSATILIEEDGIIKRVLKDEVGGIKITAPVKVGHVIAVKAVDENGNPTAWESINTGYDLIIDQGSDHKYSDIKLIYGSYEAVLNKILNGIIPMICIYSFKYIGDGWHRYGEFTPVVGISWEEASNKIIIDIGDMCYIYIYEDNSIKYVQE